MIIKMKLERDGTYPYIEVHKDASVREMQTEKNEGDRTKVRNTEIWMHEEKY